MSHLTKTTATCEQCNGAGSFTERTELVEALGFMDTAGHWSVTPGRTICTRQRQCPSCEGRGTVDRLDNK